jgi:hypothetical protein
MVGTPDALKGACPVWGGLEGDRRKVWRLHSTPLQATPGSAVGCAQAWRCTAPRRA